MRIKPDGADLLAEVSRTLKESVLPAAPPEHQYALRMSLNALSIARRQLLAGGLPDEAEAIQLSALLGVDGELPDLHRELARRVRVGDADEDATLQSLLWQVTLRQVEESAPRYLRAEKLD